MLAVLLDLTSKVSTANAIRSGWIAHPAITLSATLIAGVAQL
jgi:hypothetical protein